MSRLDEVDRESPHDPDVVVVRFTIIDHVEVKRVLPAYGTHPRRQHVADIAAQLLREFGSGRSIDPASVRVSLE